ncbi:MAG: hypothetical protein AABY22_12715 [Nanoarchaeota archaeon]|mgnify:CR=1 FL=1
MNGEAYIPEERSKNAGKRLYTETIFEEEQEGVFYRIAEKLWDKYEENMILSTSSYERLDHYLISGSLICLDHHPGIGRVKFCSETQKGLEAILSLFGVKNNDSQKMTTLYKIKQNKKRSSHNLH